MNNTGTILDKPGKGQRENTTVNSAEGRKGGKAKIK